MSSFHHAPHHRARIQQPPSSPEGGGGSKILLLLLLTVVVFGLLYLFFRIQLMMTTSRIEAALGEHVMNTVQYAKVTQTAIDKHVTKATNAAKVKPGTFKSFAAILPKEDFASLGDYYLKDHLKGYQSAQPLKSPKTPGCSMIDALSPDTTLRTLAGQKGKRSFRNRVDGMTSRDGTAVVTGTKANTTTPDGAIVLALDLLVDFKYLFFKRKLWFHKRCYFFAKRRPYTASNQHKP